MSTYRNPALLTRRWGVFNHTIPTTLTRKEAIHWITLRLHAQDVNAPIVPPERSLSILGGSLL